MYLASTIILALQFGDFWFYDEIIHVTEFCLCSWWLTNKEAVSSTMAPAWCDVASETGTTKSKVEIPKII